MDPPESEKAKELVVQDDEDDDDTQRVGEEQQHSDTVKEFSSLYNMKKEIAKVRH
jgi:hypothetical protein